MKQTGFSLASILLLTVVVAIYAGSLRTASRRGMDAELIALLGVAGVAIGVTIGATLGGRYGPRKSGPVIGVCAGLAFGAPSMILTAMPQSLPVIGVGSIFLIGFAAVVRAFSARTPRE